MKLATISLLALSASSINARFIDDSDIDQVVFHPEIVEAELYDVEVEPGKFMRVTEEEKWDLRRVGCPISLLDKLLNPRCTEWH